MKYSKKIVIFELTFDEKKNEVELYLTSLLHYLEKKITFVDELREGDEGNFLIKHHPIPAKYEEIVNREPMVMDSRYVSIQIKILWNEQEKFEKAISSFCKKRSIHLTSH